MKQPPMRLKLAAIVTLSLALVPFAERRDADRRNSANRTVSGIASGIQANLNPSESGYRIERGHRQEAWSEVSIETTEAFPPFRVCRRSPTSKAVLSHVLLPTGTLPAYHARQRSKHL